MQVVLCTFLLVVLLSPVSGLMWIPTLLLPSSGTIHRSEQRCGSTSINLGNLDLVQCEAAAQGQSGCHGYFMWSPTDHPSAGCHCCQPGGGEDGGASDVGWNVYEYPAGCLPCHVNATPCITLRLPASLCIFLHLPLLPSATPHFPAPPCTSLHLPASPCAAVWILLRPPPCKSYA